MRRTLEGKKERRGRRLAAMARGGLKKTLQFGGTIDSASGSGYDQEAKEKRAVGELKTECELRKRVPAVRKGVLRRHVGKKNYAKGRVSRLFTSHGKNMTIGQVTNVWHKEGGGKKDGEKGEAQVAGVE